MIRQRRGVPAQRPQGRAPAHQRRRFAGMGGQKTVETGSGFGEVVLTQQGQAVMQQRGGIAWIDRQRPADQLDGFATVALLQPQHSQQIECGKDAGVEPENFPVKRFRFGQAALQVKCDGLAAQGVEVHVSPPSQQKPGALRPPASTATSVHRRPLCGGETGRCRTVRNCHGSV